MAMTVVTALYIRIIGQSACQIGLHLRVRISAGSAEQLNPGVGQGISRAASDATADQHVHTVLLQKSRQRAVAAAGGIHHPGGGYPAVFHLVKLKLLCVSEMLEHFSVIIRHCNNHKIVPFLFIRSDRLCRVRRPTAATFARTSAPAGAVQHEVAAADFQPAALHQKPGQLLSGLRVQHLHGSTPHIHERGALLLGFAQIVDQPDRLILLHRHGDVKIVSSGRFRPETAAAGHGAHPPRFAGSRHSFSFPAGGAPFGTPLSFFPYSV